MICAYLLWYALRLSFVEPEPAKPVKVLDQSNSKSALSPIVSARAENIQDDQILEQPANADTPPVLVECRDAIITLISKSEKPLELCVDSRDVIQDGSSRTYQFSAKSAEKYALKIRANGTVIEAVELWGEKSVFARCETDQCVGIVIGKRDATGSRGVKIDASLFSANLDDERSSDPITIRADLKTKPDHEVAALTCPGQGVTMIGSDNSSVSFCPLGGNGFSATEDGSSITYQFTNLEGEMVTVAVDQSEAIKKIGFDGDRLFCVSEECSGAQILAPNEKGERIFSFYGVMLREAGAGESLVLNGTLKLQPLSLN